MTAIVVDHLGDHRFGVTIRGHQLEVDQPRDEGGDDAGPTPTELFVAGLAACVAHYAQGYLHRHRLQTRGLRVTAEFCIEPRPARVGAVTIVIDAPGLPEHRRAALLAVAAHCTVHNTLDDVPPIRLELVPTAGTAA